MVRLTGELRCRDAREAGIVAEHLPSHVVATRAEPGCVSFEVVATDDPLVWHVAEQFRDAAALRAHQARAGASEWGRVTAGIERRYEVTGV